MLEHLLTWLFSLYYFGYLNLCMPICQQEPPRRKASETNGDLSECAKKGIAGEPLVNLLLLLCIHIVAFSISWHDFCYLPTSHWKSLVKPRRGDALLFFSLHPTAIPDTNSLHAGCPVIEGEKWSATKWIHVDSFDKILNPASGNCTDLNDSCDRWAALGECTKNPEYMVGSPELPGYCRRSCKVC